MASVHQKLLCLVVLVLPLNIILKGPRYCTTYKQYRKVQDLQYVHKKSRGISYCMQESLQYVVYQYVVYQCRYVRAVYTYCTFITHLLHIYYTPITHQ